MELHNKNERGGPDSILRYVCRVGDTPPATGLPSYRERSCHTPVWPLKELGQLPHTKFTFGSKNARRMSDRNKGRESRVPAANTMAFPGQTGDLDSCPDPEALSFLPSGSPPPGFPPKLTSCSTCHFLLSNKWRCPGPEPLAPNPTSLGISVPP